MRRLGVIGGSGLYDLRGCESPTWDKVETPFGLPSHDVMLGALEGQPIAFLPRHGNGHVLLPSEVNVRANVCALKQVGCTEIFSLSAAGSLREEYPPGTFVLVDQFIDRTFARPKTFFGDGLVAHVSIARPVCPRLADVVEDAARCEGIPVARGGTYVVMEGPQFSTRAESDLHRSYGASIIGMTAMPEVKLAREAELCYAIAAIVTDYDCWREADGAVTADLVADTMRTLGARAAALVRAVARRLPREAAPCPHGCDRALDGAVMTEPAYVSQEARRRLDPIVRRVAGDRW